MDKKSLWEILVPDYDKSGNQYPIEHHWQWDEKVRQISGGLTIFKTAKGQWLNPEGKLFSEKMIPVRINCSEKDISDIIDMTIEHYTQEAVLAYEISEKVMLKYAPKPDNREEYTVDWQII
jgi:hypothetical protein